MNKRALNRVLKQINRVIDLDNAEITENEGSGYYDTINHSLTRELVVQTAIENPTLTEFELYKIILAPVIIQNPTNYSGLFAIYELIARQANVEENEEAFELYQKAIYYLTLRKLEGAKTSGAKEYYIYIAGHPSCCGLCSALDEKVFEPDEFLTDLPIPIKGCLRDDHLCSSVPLAISKSRWLRLLKEGKIK